MLKVFPLLQMLEDASGCECVSLNKATIFKANSASSYSHGTKYYGMNVEIFDVRGTWKFLENI